MRTIPSPQDFQTATVRAGGHELVAAGLLILAGVTDRDQLQQAVRVGYERGKGSLRGYDPTDATG
jgi:hypothetical protein